VTSRKLMQPAKPDFRFTLRVSMRVACIACAMFCVSLDARSCEVNAAAQPALQRLQTVMATGRFIAYQPTAMQMLNGEATPASRESIKQDLAVLRPRFDGIITYSSISGTEQVADVAATLGFRAVIMGVWDLNNATERANALAAIKRQPNLVAGVSLGNERWLAGKLQPPQLAEIIRAFRKQAPGVALTTTEPFHLFLKTEAKPIMEASDFMLVNVHPITQSWFRNAADANAAEFVVNVVNDLQRVACGPVLVKETGEPSAPTASGFTAERQSDFYHALQKQFLPAKQRAFAYFSAFDAPWRAYDESPVAGSHPEEAHFGLYDEQRRAKQVAQQIPLLK
jgi:exo-beta-1,3-glucanase (GH17 family)